VPGLAFFTLSLISPQARRSFPGRVEPVIRSDAAKAASKAQAAAQQAHSSIATRRPGRPKGRKNKNKAAVTLTPAWVRLKSLRDALLPLVAACIPWTSLVLEGHFGQHNAWHAAQPGHWPRISKRRADSALSWPYDGP
jgi:putative transposase